MDACDVVGGVVWCGWAAAEDEVCMGVAVGALCYGRSVVVDSYAGVVRACGDDAIDGEGDIAGYAIFKTDGEGGIAGKMAVHGRRYCAGSDHSPGNVIREIRDEEWMEKFCCYRDPHCCYLAVEFSSLSNAFCNRS